MVRSRWKIIQYFKFTDVLKKKKKSEKKKFKIYNANFVISLDLVGFIFFVYTGNKFRKVIITEDSVGFLLSSLILTRFNDGELHTKAKKKKK